MRHTICAAPVRKTATTPASRACRVGHAAPAGTLVALGGSTLCSITRLARAGRGAVALTTVAVAAQQDLAAATCAQEQAGWTVHGRPGQAEVLDGRVPARHTAVAPPSSARCRARHGHQASRPERPLPCPPASASGTVVARAVAAARASVCRMVPTAVTDACPCAVPHTPAHQQRRRACLAALQGGQAGERRSAQRRAHALTGASHDEAPTRRRVLTTE